jgi:hypothetical protein
LLTPTIAQRTLAIGAGLLNGNASGLTAEKWVRQIFTYAPFTAQFRRLRPPIPTDRDQCSAGADDAVG